MNRLATATSPYLLQHKDNPVAWYEWGDEAFAEARRRDVPVLLSIGYSSCHWCHVMAHESFENEQIAAQMNEQFVSIKVDREERPDLDAIYMDATLALTGSGGWPMTVFLDHQARPFYAGTYFPPEPRQGSPSLPQLLRAISEAWSERRDDISGAAARLSEALRLNAGVELEGIEINQSVLDAAVEQLSRQFDDARGGFAGAPKFPPSMLLEFLLREAARTGNRQALAMAESTLEAMARGGLYDQLGGGFARYSVDAAWVVPHFEKMLYDNALLLRVYAHWWRLTASPLAERVVRDTASFLLQHMRTEEGAFAASFDADSEGVEGRFYVWSAAQLVEELGVEDAEWAQQLLSVSVPGSFEHEYSTLRMLRDPEDWDRWRSIRERLLAARARRVSPGRDDKVVAAWNGLAIAALAECGALFEEPAWITAAAEAAELLMRVHLRPDTQLLRTSIHGVAGSSPGVLNDYADVAEGLLALAQVTSRSEWITRTGQLLDAVLERFRAADAGFHTTPADGATLLVRPREWGDNAEPSGWSAAAHALLTYSALTGSATHRGQALRALAPLARIATSTPRAAGWALAACSALLDGPAEITLHLPTSPELTALAFRATAPGAVVLRSADGPRGTAMVCRHSTCSLPSADPELLAGQIGARR